MQKAFTKKNVVTKGQGCAQNHGCNQYDTVLLEKYILIVREIYLNRNIFNI